MGSNGECGRALIRLLESAGLTSIPTDRPPSPRRHHLKALAHEIDLLYEQLGGVQLKPRLAPSSWDACLGGIVVELDEEQHFNRFRGVTLAPAWAAALPWQGAYRTYCDAFEDVCMKAASHHKFWTNPSSEIQFGKSGPRETGLGHPVGPARWRQRALYDAMRDAYAVALGTRLARLSVHDVVDGNSLGDVLQGRATCSANSLRELVVLRTLHG